MAFEEGGEMVHKCIHRNYLSLIFLVEPELNRRFRLAYAGQRCSSAQFSEPTQVDPDSNDTHLALQFGRDMYPGRFPTMGNGCARVRSKGSGHQACKLAAFP